VYNLFGQFIYQLDEILLQLIKVFAGITIFIGCLGLYGLVSLMAVQRTKEIGIRKVLGAEVSDILWLFGLEFARLIVVAFLLAAPIVYWLMSEWLKDFVYRIPVSGDIFVLAVSATLLFSVVMVGYQSIKAALANPVHWLRNN
jgi:putative ABC transport system permease protein